MRWLKGLVIGMGVLIVGGTITLVAVIAQRLGGAAAPGPVDLALHQPAGTHIGGVAAAGDRIVVWVLRPDGERLLLVDPRGGRGAGEIRLGE